MPAAMHHLLFVECLAYLYHTLDHAAATSASATTTTTSSCLQEAR